MNFKELTEKRYAAKGFTEKEVSEKDLDAVLEAIRMSASSFGIQPYVVHVVTNEEMLQKLQAVSFNQPQIGTCSHLLVFCALQDVTERITGYEALMKETGTSEEQITGYTGVIRGFVERMNKEEILAWTQKQTYLALANGMHAATEQGFDSCPMEGFLAEKYSEILGLPENHVPTVLLPIGYASDTPKPKLRFTKEELFKIE